MTMKLNKQILSLLLAAVMVLTFAPTAILAGAKTPKTKTVTVRAVEDHFTSNSHDEEWSFTYSDDYFTKSGYTFRQDLACMTLGLAMASFTSRDAINEGVRRGYRDGFLRKSIVEDPLRRTNTGDNSPAVIHTDIVDGDHVKILFAPKGFGSENMSRVRMFPPSAGEAGCKDFVVETVKEAGGNPCPPIVVGVGLGASFDRVTMLAKKALLRPIGTKHEDPFYARIEQELLERINALDIGPQGFGGRTTALAVHILAEPTHIAGLPCAVNINCHVSRHRERIL